MTEDHIRQLQAAILHQKASRFSDAATIYNRVLIETPDNFDCVYLLAMLHTQQGDFSSAAAMFRRAAQIRPNILDVHYNLAVALGMAGNHAEAAQTYKRILEISPRHSQARNNYAASLLSSGRVVDALHQYDELVALNPDQADAYNNRGMALQYLKRFDDAVGNYDKAIALRPSFAEAYVNRGNALATLGRPDDALASYSKAIAFKPDFADAYSNAGNIYCNRKSYGEAVNAYNRALSLRPDDSDARSMRLYAKMQLCDWSNFGAECLDLTACIDRDLPIYPFGILAISTSLDQQFRCARLFAKTRYPLSDKPLWHGDIYKHDKIRIAYVSADFRPHAVSSLMAGMFECHEKSRFEVTAISIGPDDTSGLRERLKGSFDRFIDAQGLRDDEIAARVKEAEIDILIDLNGYTEGARIGVFAHRAAPIQVGYLGYAGTTGSDYIDYIIADHTLIPGSEQVYYTEKIAYLPNSYQVNDTQRPIADKAFSRAELGLPAQGFIFCCFNNSFKIVPDIFDRWARILKQVEGSVLWLREDNASIVANLKKEAAARGISAERLVFAERMPLPEHHLARHRSADLFLDTLPFNAQTTASDALWTGLPVLTQIGETFTGRVAASLLNAIGLPELITQTSEEYEKAAIELATDPAKLALVRHKLAENRLTTSLFKTQLFTRHIEAAYTAMYERHHAGLPPDHIDVPR